MDTIEIDGVICTIGPEIISPWDKKVTQLLASLNVPDNASTRVQLKVALQGAYSKGFRKGRETGYTEHRSETWFR